jgi:hypothetical protein
MRQRQQEHILLLIVPITHIDKTVPWYATLLSIYTTGRKPLVYTGFYVNTHIHFYLRTCPFSISFYPCHLIIKVTYFINGWLCNTVNMIITLGN